MKHKRIATSAEVYAVIFARHRDQLKVFSSFSDPDGTWQGADGTTGRMETGWGLDGADCPLMETRAMWPITRGADGEPRTGKQHIEHWLCYPVEE